VFQLSFNPSTFQLEFRNVISCACLMYVICFIHLNWAKMVQYYSWFMRFTVICVCLSVNHCAMLLHECSEYIAPERTQLAAAAQNTAGQL
jgi:hypothetical protein